MRNIKVLKNFHFKIRYQTILVFEPNSNLIVRTKFLDTLERGKNSQYDLLIHFKQEVLQKQLFIKKNCVKDLYLALLFMQKTLCTERDSNTNTTLYIKQTSKHVCTYALRGLGLYQNKILNYKILNVRSLNISFQRRERYKMIRPLLDLKRESITMICKDFKIPVYPDQSNKSVQYSRNRIRKQIIPSIKYFINAQVESSLFKLAELLNKEQSFLYSVLKNSKAKSSSLK